MKSRSATCILQESGNDILYDEAQVEQGRNFCNKIWNAYRLMTGWTVDGTLPQPEASATAVKWFRSKLDLVAETVEEHFSKFRISDALMAIYKLFWDDFCAWYLEIVKPAYGAAMDAGTYRESMGFFDALLRMIHPIMPFITEELWHGMAERKDGATIMFEPYPVSEGYDRDFIGKFEDACEAVTAVRSIRQQKNISPKEALTLRVKDFPSEMDSVICRLANVSIEKTASFGDTSEGVSFLVRTYEMFVPLSGLVDVAEETAKLEAVIAYQEKFLESVRKKLSNERFVNNAPANVVENERKKEADSLAKIEAAKASLAALKGKQ